MSRIVNSTYITLDGAVENPHLWPSLGKEDPHLGKEGSGSAISFEIQNELLHACEGVLMGRRTYEAFAAAWPTRSGGYSDRINSMRKYVVSSTLKNPSWKNTAMIGGDVIREIARLKSQPGRDLVQYGLGSLSFLLIENGLMDEIRLWVHPLILGSTGPKVPHFLGCSPTRFRLDGTRTLPNGIVILSYTVKPDRNGTQS